MRKKEKEKLRNLIRDCQAAIQPECLMEWKLGDWLELRKQLQEANEMLEMEIGSD